MQSGKNKYRPWTLPTPFLFVIKKFNLSSVTLVKDIVSFQKCSNFRTKNCIFTHRISYGENNKGVYHESNARLPWRNYHFILYQAYTEKEKMVKKQDVAALIIYTGVLNVGFSGSKSVQVRLNMYSFKYTNKNLTRQFSYGVA